MTAMQEQEQEILDLLNRNWSRGPLVIEAETAVEIRAIIADNRALRRQVGTMRHAFATLSPVIQNLWRTAVMHVTPVLALIGPYLEATAPMGAEWDVKVMAGYEEDPEPRPRYGDRGTCAVCSGEIMYFQLEAGDGEVLKTGWDHTGHTADGHGAQLGGPA